MSFSTPDSDQRAFREPSPGPRLVIICIVSIALMAIDNQNQTIRTIRSLLGTAVYPLRVLVDAPATFGHWLGENLSARSSLLEENSALNDRILEQSAKLQRLAAINAENERLRALLESTTRIDDRVLIAEIMSVDMNPFRHQIVINKGSNEGIYVGQALIDAQGIIGQVTRTQALSAEALLITDIDHALPVELLRNRLRTIAVGTGDLERLSLPFLPRNADVMEGDLLVTSGLGGTFPAGYPVGFVSEISQDSGKSFLAINAEPAAALNRIREVLLIWTETVGTAPLDDAPADVPDSVSADASTDPAAAGEPSTEPSAPDGDSGSGVTD
jgi:rod shape-determining protein MreC